MIFVFENTSNFGLGEPSVKLNQALRLSKPFCQDVHPDVAARDLAVLAFGPEENLEAAVREAGQQAAVPLAL